MGAPGTPHRQPGRFRSQTFAPQEQRAAMNRLVSFIVARAVSEDGQDLLEYALLCALIALVALGAVQTVGNTINSVFWQAIAASNI
jgi:Flp pilus assembly pilin Flp